MKNINERGVGGGGVCVVGFLMNQLSNKKRFKLLYIFKHAPKNYFVLFI
jgi:hypothetical protein